MSIYLLDLTTFATLFEFDCELKESQRTEVEWTSKPIEDGAIIADYGVIKEDVFRVEGLMTAWPLIGVTARNPQRVIQADAKLRALAKAKQPLTLITGWWTPTIVIKSVDGSTGIAEGESLRVSLECSTITLPKPVYTTIPASKLKPTVRRGSAAPTTGGAAAGKKKPPATAPTPASWLSKLLGL